MRYLIFTVAFLLVGPALAQQRDAEVQFPSLNRMNVILAKCEARDGCEVVSRDDEKLTAVLRVDSDAVLNAFPCMARRCHEVEE